MRKERTYMSVRSPHHIGSCREDNPHLPGAPVQLGAKTSREGGLAMSGAVGGVRAEGMVPAGFPEQVASLEGCTGIMRHKRVDGVSWVGESNVCQRRGWKDRWA